MLVIFQNFEVTEIYLLSVVWLCRWECLSGTGQVRLLTPNSG